MCIISESMDSSREGGEFVNTDSGGICLLFDDARPAPVTELRWPIDGGHGACGKRMLCYHRKGTSVAAATAIVYQHEGARLEMITSAVNNVVGDLSGLICDGAKPGCSMKTVSGVDAAMRAAFMAIDGYGIAADDGLLGHSAEQSIRNLSRITLEGMFSVDPTLVTILQEKIARNENAEMLKWFPQ